MLQRDTKFIFYPRFSADIAARVTVAGMKSSIQRARSLLYPPVPITLQNLAELLADGTNERIVSTQDGKDSILGGSVTVNGMTSIIFLSKRMRKILRRVKVVYCDGTFGSRPNNPQSAQILQIVAVVRNTVSEYHVHCNCSVSIIP